LIANHPPKAYHLKQPSWYGFFSSLGDLFIFEFSQTIKVLREIARLEGSSFTAP